MSNNPSKIFPITRAQRVAMFKVFQRDFPTWRSPVKRLNHRIGEPPIPVSSIQWRHFRAKVQPSFDGSGCIMLHWHGMWLGIEKDGYTHS